MIAWQNADSTDQNSLYQDPLFVNPAGADGILGYSSPANDGRDDDFHEQSLYGSDHGGSLAPVLDPLTGLPKEQTGVFTPDSTQSAAIDRGTPTDSFANEPDPNGGYINIGAYGNTSQASMSVIPYVLVTKPDGGQVWPEDQILPIHWRSEDMAGTVIIELLQGGSPVLTIAAGEANDGEFLWTIPETITPGNNYRIRVTRDDGSAAYGDSLADFTIAAPVHDFYVNDATVVDGNDWTSNPGNDASTGFFPDSPKASIAAILNAYTLQAGDTIWVDNGTCNLSSNIVLAAADSGVRIVGYNPVVAPPTFTRTADPNRAAILDRGNTSGGSYVFQMAGATNVTINHVTMTGATYGVMAGTGVGSTHLTVSNSEIYGMSQGGILVSTSNSDALLNANRIHDLPTGIDIHQYNYDAGPARATVSNNVIYATSTGIIASGYGLAGPDHVTLSGNLVHDNSICGVQAQYNVLVTGNTVYDQLNSGAYGIEADYGVQVQQNVVHDNANGIYLNGYYGGSTASANRVYNNSNVGIYTVSGNAVLGNTIYSNSIGVLNDYNYGSTQVSNNLIYANSNEGIWVRANYFNNYGATPSRQQ